MVPRKKLVLLSLCSLNVQNKFIRFWRWVLCGLYFSSCLQEKDHKLEASKMDNISACVRNCNDMLMLASDLIPAYSSYWVRTEVCFLVGQRSKKHNNECGLCTYDLHGSSLWLLPIPECCMSRLPWSLTSPLHTASPKYIQLSVVLSLPCPVCP